MCANGLEISKCGSQMSSDDVDVNFRCMYTKQMFTLKNPEHVTTANGRHFYVGQSPYATQSKKGNPCKPSYSAMPKAHLEKKQLGKYAPKDK